MITSRSITDLCPTVEGMARVFLGFCAHDPWLVANGITVSVICTRRDFDAQAALYAQGRTAPGKIVTNAKAGESWHNFDCAFDVLPLRHGKPVWGTSGNGMDDNPADDGTDDREVWQRVGSLGLRAGLEWAGNWKTFREFPHFQFTGGLSLTQARQGRLP